MRVECWERHVAHADVFVLPRAVAAERRVGVKLGQRKVRELADG